MTQIGQINATWTSGARTELERFMVNARAPGAVLSLFKNADDPAASRWSYGVFTLDRVRTLESAMQTRGHALRYSLDGVTVAISNVNHARELEGKVLDYDGPGYLVARAATAH
jgi:hypothetical protein